MLAERLLQVVKSQPDAVAIRDAHRGDISYSALWDLAKDSSNKIDELFKNEKYVGIVADQDAYAVIASMAVMFTDRIIIPIDPRHDTKLIERMLAPFTSKVICGVEKDFSATFTATSLQNIVVESYDTNYGFETKNGDAYILHTSGTTGRPKPVLADQAALRHVAEVLSERYHITADSKVLQFAYLSFDSSLIEIWSTLFGGGTLVIAGKRLREDLYGCLEELLKNRSITTATLPSSVANGVRDEYLYNFDTLILAGDECPAELANRLYKHIPHLINAYGPTESIICATTYEIHEGQTSRVPIGTPLPGMEVVIENPDQRGHGEMVLVSSYLAQGYAKDDSRTKKKFGINNTGGRYYKSGDIGSVREDGNYDFLGRVDHQIKINGQRIEIEGIEALIRNITKRNDVAVIAVSNNLYCVYRSDTKLSEFDNLATKLQDALPSYAVPKHYVPIQNMLLDMNGKIDRKALKSFISGNRYSEDSEPQGLSNEQSKMTTIWAKLLDISQDKVRSDSSFFSLGGDSLGALKLVKAINEHYLVNLKLSEVIADPATPDSILEAIERHKGERQ